MKAVLISIHPKFCELIFNGKKTIEVRCSAPKLQTPFKVYVYMTKNKWIFKLLPFLKNRFAKVIGEFVCDRIEKFSCYMDAGYYPEYLIEEDTLKKMCLSYDELFDYLIGKDGYGWHITKPKLFDEPRELGEFVKPCDWNYDCCTCKRAVYELTKAEAKLFYGCDREITRPPQSWFYVEELQ